MINLTSDKIRTDVVRRDFFNEDDSFFIYKESAFFWMKIEFMY